MDNLFTTLPSDASAELVDVLAAGPRVRIERIVSTGHASPAGFWYDQAQDEWVVVLKGEATLRLETENQLIHMRPGDWIRIPAHCRHRVESTSMTEPTIWLAVFFDGP